MICNVFWGSHGCDRKYLHANPICMCGNGCSFLHFDTGTVLIKTEIRPFLGGDPVGTPSGGCWADDPVLGLVYPPLTSHVDPPREAVAEHEHRCGVVMHVWRHAENCRAGYWLTCSVHG